MELDYAEQAALQFFVTATNGGAAQTYLKGNPVKYDGGRIKVEVFIPLAQAPTNSTYLYLHEDGVQVALLTELFANVGTPIKVEYFRKPTPGIHTYSVTAFSAHGDGFFGAGDGTDNGQFVPAFLRITRA